MAPTAMLTATTPVALRVRTRRLIAAAAVPVPSAYHCPGCGISMRVVGVTGTIGAGKSTVLRWLEAHGACTVDADTVVHRLYESDGDLQERLRQRFGLAGRRRRAGRSPRP